MSLDSLIYGKKEYPVQLTFFENEIIDRLVKDEDYLAFTANIEKRENFDIYILNVKKKREMYHLTPHE